jgi:TPP-dependent pyruvate/acetoin dehydrogenase alpha subunit
MIDALTTEARVGLFERMLLMRRFEEMVVHVAADHKYIGRNHLYIGHEATGAPVIALMQPGDLAYTTHRNHGHIIARGIVPGRALAEIMGRADGLCGGRGGTWHMTDPHLGFQSTSAMVGGSIALAAGGGFALQHMGRGNVSLALFGDGVLDEGIAYEALNFASVFALPILFLCENNSKAGERPSSMLAATQLTDVPRALAIATESVDGADADAVHDVVSRAFARVRETGEPFFVEARLERWPGSHSEMPELTTGVTDVGMAWDAARISGPHTGWIRDCDPILRYARTLLEARLISRDEIVKIDRAVSAQIVKARAFAEASPFPAADSALAGVFA